MWSSSVTKTRNFRSSSSCMLLNTASNCPRTLTRCYCCGNAKLSSPMAPSTVTCSCPCANNFKPCSTSSNHTRFACTKRLGRIRQKRHVVAQPNSLLCLSKPIAERLELRLPACTLSYVSCCLECQEPFTTKLKLNLSRKEISFISLRKCCVISTNCFECDALLFSGLRLGKPPPP